MLNKIFKKETLSSRSRNFLRITQHIYIAVIFAVLFYVLNGSTIQNSNGTEYRLRNEDSDSEYEDSLLFNEIFKTNLKEISDLVGISTLLETDGVYDSEKTIDVTAFVNRNSIIQSDYITGVYKVADLIKWSQNGFEYDERSFNGNDSARFLSDTTVYTHLMKNNAENGMNSFLNSQLDNNIVRTNIKVSGVGDGAGTHTVLIPRYQTVYSEDIQDIVSTWDGYNGLCANITEAASTMAMNYDEYLVLKEKFNSRNSNLKYYITRTINARTEVYTNIPALQNGTNGINVDDTFKKLGRYVYFCPYDLAFESNTKLDEAALRKLLDTYDYAFPDQMKFYVGIDLDNLTTVDDFAIGAESFNRYMPYYRQLYAIIVIFALAYIANIIHVVYFEGKIEYADGTVGGVEKIDIIPIEIVIAVSAAIMVAMYCGFNYVYSHYASISSSELNSCLALAAFVFVGDNAFSYGFYSLVRRFKSHMIYESSLLHAFHEGVKKLSNKMTVRQNIFVRSVVPYILSTFLNIYIVVKYDIAGIVAVTVLDVVIGIYLFNLNNDKLILFEALRKIGNGDIDVKVDIKKLHGGNVYLGKELNSIANSVEDAVNRSMRDEKLKADLITNVSHDIKTPLTSIINYVELLKRENIDDPKIRDYIKILENKSQRLRQLTEDLVEASKISSGNITLHMQEINYAEIVNQILGEFYEKFEDSDLMPILKCEKYDVVINADPRQLYRVIENLMNNVCKYAMPGTRVYMDLEVNEDHELDNRAVFSIKNISRNELNIKAEELTERFIRGDISRSTEGSGLGLSIARSLTESMGGVFNIVLDGDLFKSTVTFDTVLYKNGNSSTESSVN
ncbi:MAG: HAMP domain-containing histidine kinase [Butyrivibrio sp.]|nr:HAMP domain-containing histidine kinase [Butyrivibrio sp.]